MKKQKFAESQIVNAIKEHDAGKSAIGIVNSSIVRHYA